jgi:hypothetical protein
MAPAPREEIDPDWAAHMADITRLARRIYDGLVAIMADEDPDVRLAWASGLRQDPRHHWAELTRTAINDARDAGWSWRAIAQITEGTDDPTVASRVTSKQQWRNQQAEDFAAGVGEFQVDPNGGPPGV